VLLADGCLYAPPCNADGILRIDPVACAAAAELATMRARHKAERAAQTAAKQRAKADPKGATPAPEHRAAMRHRHKAEAAPLVKAAAGAVAEVCAPLNGKQKWYGALTGSDGCMYAIPNCSTGVLRFDPTTQTATVVEPTSGPLPTGGWKWHGGGIGGDGRIYGVPAHATSVLVIDPSKGGAVTTIGGDGRLSDLKYKYGGATRMGNGDMIFFPSDGGRVLRVRCGPGIAEDDRVELIGPDFNDAAHVAQGFGKNKWQNGFLGRDGAVYGLPCRAPAVLRVSAEGEVTTLGGPWHGPEKWEGGVMDRESGVIYAMPDHGSHVLRIDPGPARRK